MSELAEGARLEIVCVVYSSTEGSNPSLSAINNMHSRAVFYFYHTRNNNFIFMSYIVLARKYRPQKFDEVVKQEHITQTLINSISQNRVAHAILFSGPRGTGKTTVARILAKAMNCEKGPTPDPCNICRSCVEITRGSGVDVFEIDGASNNSVDNIRNLRENIKYKPAHSSFKIYIIDEVHMLSTSAFNALLKTLEEPPEHVMFFFATTEPHKIPVTILSRCQRHDFRRIDTESIVRHMKSLCDKEQVDISMESLGLIAQEGDGSMRDSLSFLDQVVSSSNNAITLKHVVGLLGIIDRKVLLDISENILQKNIVKALDFLDEIYSCGHDLQKFYMDLVEYFRDLLIVKIGKKVNKLVDLPEYEIKTMISQVDKFSTTYINQILDFLFEHSSEIRYSTNTKLAIEMIFISMMQVEPVIPIDNIIDRLENLRKNFSQVKPENFTLASPAADTPESFALPSPAVSTPEIKEAEDTASHYVPVNTQEQKPEDIWKSAVDFIVKSNPAIGALLNNSIFKKISGKNLEIEVTGSEFHIHRLKNKKNSSILKKVCKDFFGKDIKIDINAKTVEKDIKTVEKQDNSNIEQEALDNPLVKDIMEIFKGSSLVSVKVL